jgi:hypothetical protein
MKLILKSIGFKIPRHIFREILKKFPIGMPLPCAIAQTLNGNETLENETLEAENSTTPFYRKFTRYPRLK